MILNIKDLLSKEDLQFELDDFSLTKSKLDDLSKAELFIAPGLIDLQVNGYKGIDFNDDQLSLEKIDSVIQELLKDGVTGFLPSLISNDPNIIEKNLKLFKMATEKSEMHKSCILGIHLEGPFISSSPGAIGAHPQKWIQKPNFELIEKWQEISGNLIKLITLSPEYEGSLEFIRTCIPIGIKISIGHTNATVEQIKKAVEAGASLSTHTGNAMSSHIHRHKNILFEQIANDGLFASIIADGHHLPKDLIKIIYRSKPGKVFLISDSTKFTGMKPGIYESIIGGKVELKENKRLCIVGNEEYLAGAACSLNDCINYLSQEKLLSFEEAWDMASVIPYKYLYETEMPSLKKEAVLISYVDGLIKVHLTLKNGEVIL